MNKYEVKTEFRAVDRMSAFFDKGSAKAKSFGKSLSGALANVDGKMSKVSGALKGVALGAAVAGAGLAYSGQGALDFEQTLANISAVANPTAQDLERMSDTAQQVGADFGFSGGIVAASMEAMAKQGVETQGVIEGIGGVAAAAAADGSSLDETMGGLLATMAGMGKAPADLQHMADVMAKAGDATAASIGTLTDSMAVFGPTARALDIPLESAVGQLAILQDAGLDASSAGTTLSAVYSKLAAPMGRTQKALKKLGISVKDAATGNLKKPADLLNEIFQKVGKIKGNVGKTGILTELVGLESQKALLNLVGSLEQGADGTSKFEKVMGGLTENVDGYAQKIAAIKMDTTAGDLKRLDATVDSLKITMFGLVRGPLRGAIEGTREWVTENKGLITQRVQDTISWISENQDNVVLGLKAIGVGLAVFTTMAVAVKVATVATAAYELATMAATGASTAFAFVTNAERVAVISSTVASGAATAARWAYNAALTVGAVGTTRVTVAEIASRAAQLAGAAASGIAAAAKWAYTAALTASTVGLGAYATAAYASVSATIAAAAPFAPFLVTITAVAAAIAAVVAAYKAWQELSGDLAESGGITGTIGAMWDQGTWDPFVAHDEVQNRKARAEAKKRDAGTVVPGPVVSSSEQLARQITENTTTTTQKSELVVKAPEGSKLKGKPGPLTTVKVRRSGEG